MKVSKYIAVFLSFGFAGIVLIERVPGVLISTSVPYEWLMFGLFKISLIDDITHGLSAILGLIALMMGYRMWVKWLILIGGYYSLDAIFYVINGFITGQPLLENLGLNFPHLVIMVLVIIALSHSVKKIDLK